MKTMVRWLALAGMLAMVFPLASVASENGSKEQKKVVVEDPVVLAGKTLQPGHYKVEWQGNGPRANVNFMQYGKTVVTVTARVAQLQKKAPYDAVVESTQNNGKKTISEIEWNNQRQALMFGRAAHHSKSGS